MKLKQGPSGWGMALAVAAYVAAILTLLLIGCSNTT